ncbi:sulfite exporter TauE/SafE family protein [Paraburkholderia flagellata]|uniref:sulfite exporter TauE/SafE family protein n=1 Tax=Paraburkholderia flagellata TaxID=2883241 RepID=UPI001F42D48B|nr:sulfite exporter TauE/SafE family protein [Paraburkholderia flagellata]
MLNQDGRIKAMDTEPEPGSPAVSSLSSSTPPSRTWQLRTQWAVLVIATVLCLSLSTQSGVNPLVIGSVLLASAVSSIAGFAFSAVCGAMLFHLSGDPVQIVQIMIVCSVANQTAMVWSLKREIQWRELTVFLIGGAVGLPVGITVLLTLDRHVYTHVLGAFLVLYGCYMLARKPLVIGRQATAFDAFAGFLGGITGGAAGFPGAFVTIWCGFKGWNKGRQRAMFQPFILIMQVAALAAISLLRHSSGKVGFDPAILLCIPASLLGTTVGMTLYQRLSDNHFARAVNLLMIASGISYFA